MADQSKSQQRTTLYIPPEYRVKLEEIARRLGYIQSRGAGTGKIGNISALMCAIAKGDLSIAIQKQEDNNDSNI